MPHLAQEATANYLVLQRLLSWWRSKSPRNRLRHCLATATAYEEWEEAAFALDELLSLDLWRQNPTSKYYDYRLIMGRLTALMTAREDEDILTLVNLLRSGLVRNLGNITSPKLFLHAYAGTKLLIDDYITQVGLSIQHVTALQTVPVHDSGFTSQAKVELLHDTRQAFGRTTLLLQGGSIFGLCHLGVVKALHLQGLLPRIITGTATGALIAALVGVHSEDELLAFLHGDNIDLSAFDRQQSTSTSTLPSGWGSSWLSSTLAGRGVTTLMRRVKRYFTKGYFLDAGVLEECVRTNLGDLTFEEAYARSKRILNITVATSGRSGTPNLLNYLTAPNVLIWSAAVASNASNNSLYAPVTIYCKDETGSIMPWPHSQDVVFQPWRHIHYDEGDSPLSRIAELFNVNHFIISQARPYLVPLLRSELNYLDRRPTTGHWNLTRGLTRLVALEIGHRLRQLNYMGLLPSPLARLLIEETVPGSNLTLVPDLTVRDFPKLFQNPDQAGLAHWISKGERGVWPAISALKVRCAVEIELDKGYQVVRRRKPAELEALPLVGRPQPNEGVPRKRRG
ncbi:putative Patatin-like serine hydrolase [Aspergillus ochraceoroseus]|uniref:Putative Patatin-like serine hydrolase n=1 Tax=Aspergillus ochraceoroseus TaxID=138278 RepID=A0A0F8W9C6_9EURO|nr:putative Patatin-like serine hydrolase [Aspergillus ochraceoroseus]